MDKEKFLDMVDDHGPVILGARDQKPRFPEPEEEENERDQNHPQPSSFQSQ